VSERGKPMRWKLKPRERGLAGIAESARPRTHLLCRGGKELARVSPSGSRWYFYGGGHNSLWSGVDYATADEAKAAAKAHVQAKEGTP
jgi:hypothetical protein